MARYGDRRGLPTVLLQFAIRYVGDAAPAGSLRSRRSIARQAAAPPAKVPEEERARR